MFVASTQILFLPEKHPKRKRTCFHHCLTVCSLVQRRVWSESIVAQEDCLSADLQEEWVERRIADKPNMARFQMLAPEI